MDPDYRAVLQTHFGDSDHEKIIGRPLFARMDGGTVSFRRPEPPLQKGEQLVYIINLSPSSDPPGFRYRMRGASVDERRAVLGEEE